MPLCAQANRAEARAAAQRARVRASSYHNAALTIILSWRGEDDGSRLRRLGSAQSINVSPNTLVAGAKALVGHQVLPDRSGITTTAQTQLDGFVKKLTGTS